MRKTRVRNMEPEHLVVRAGSYDPTKPLVINKKNKIEPIILGKPNNIDEGLRFFQSYEEKPPSPRYIHDIQNYRDIELRERGLKVNFSVEDLVMQLSNKFIEVPKIGPDGNPLVDRVSNRVITETKSVADLIKTFQGSVLASRNLLKTMNNKNIVSDINNNIFISSVMSMMDYMGKNIGSRDPKVMKNIEEGLNIRREILLDKDLVKLLESPTKEELSIYKFKEILNDDKLTNLLIDDLVLAGMNTEDIWGIFHYLEYSGDEKLLESFYKPESILILIKKIRIDKIKSEKVRSEDPWTFEEEPPTFELEEKELKEEELPETVGSKDPRTFGSESGNMSDRIYEVYFKDYRNITKDKIPDNIEIINKQSYNFLSKKRIATQFTRAILEYVRNNPTKPGAESFGSYSPSYINTLIRNNRKIIVLSDLESGPRLQDVR